MKKALLRLRDQPCAVFVGHSILEKAIHNWEEGSGRLSFIVGDERLSGWVSVLKRALKTQGWRVETELFHVTESLKSFRSAHSLYGKLLGAGANRQSVVFALGGGVIGDLAGFVAATFSRGIRWVSIPTTLLGQVDSGMGGKTAINHPEGKNLIGAFHQPSLVICDVGFLQTLDFRDQVSGLGEMIKYGLIYDPQLFRTLKKKGICVPSVDAVFRCVQLKAQTIEKDERDQLGIREALNFGHTFGHALEAATQFRRYRHGEAVILGMRAESRMAWRQGDLPQKDYLQIDEFLSQIPTPEIPKRFDSKNFLLYVAKDKKKSARGEVCFVSLQKIGKAVPGVPVSLDELLESLRYLQVSPGISKNLQ